jgi:hypothetical protein
MDIEDMAWGYEAISGFLSGILITGGVNVWNIPELFWFITGPLLVIFGLLLLLDDFFPFGRQPHLGGEAGGFIAGFALVIAIAMLIPVCISWLLAITVTLSVVKLIIRLKKKIKNK